MNSLWIKYPEIEKEILKTDEIIRKTLRSNSLYINNVIQHILNSNGKYIRAGLMILSGKIGNYNSENIIPIASALELVHLATLVHDDIIDNSNIRRGVESIQSKFGKDTAVFTGDFIFSRAYSLISDKNSKHLPKLAKAMEKVCMGEIIQNENKYNKQISVRKYLRIISGKTATIFGASMAVGSIESDITEKRAALIGNSGYYAGMAFQIIDDCLDYTSKTKTLKKNSNNDILQGLYTLPLIYAIDNDKKGEIEEILAKDNLVDNDYVNIIKKVNELSGIKEASEIAQKYLNKANSKIDELENNKYIDIIKEIFHFLVNRNY